MPDEAIALLEQALFLRMNGERPPGAPRGDPAAETWRDWERRAEVFLRKRLDAPAVEVIQAGAQWQARCEECGLLGTPPGRLYRSFGTASGVASRHRRRHAGPVGLR